MAGTGGGIAVDWVCAVSRGDGKAGAIDRVGGRCRVPLQGLCKSQAFNESLLTALGAR